MKTLKVFCRTFADITLRTLNAAAVVLGIPLLMMAGYVLGLVLLTLFGGVTTGRLFGILWGQRC